MKKAENHTYGFDNPNSVEGYKSVLNVRGAAIGVQNATHQLMSFRFIDQEALKQVFVELDAIRERVVQIAQTSQDAEAVHDKRIANLMHDLVADPQEQQMIRDSRVVMEGE